MDSESIGNQKSMLDPSWISPIDSCKPHCLILVPLSHVSSTVSGYLR